VRVRTPSIVIVVGAVGSLIPGAGRTEAQYDNTEPVVQRPLAPVGETEVRYFDDGVLTSETRIPGDSAFNTSGAGSAGGGAAQPCFEYFWYQRESNPNAVRDPVTRRLVDVRTGERTTPRVLVEVTQPSTAWIFNELTPTGSWSPEQQGVADKIRAIGGFGGPPTLTSPVSLGESYFARNAPLAEASRRFEVRCGVPPEYAPGTDTFGPDGPLLRYQEVGLTDPFWNPLQRLGVLWGMVELPPFRVIAPPEVATYGGLVVNMPTWLQIEADAWRPYFTAVDHYRGWYSQLGLFPERLEFEVVGPGGTKVDCAPPESAARADAIPGFPDDLPRYYELGQLGRDCTWVPQERGQVTIRARVTYRVLLTISGFSEWLSPYVWFSDPLTLRVGELRFRNVTPEGGIGG
jgi:hypothetical protein